MVQEDLLRYNVRQALISEIENWLGKEIEDTIDKPLMRHVRDLLRNDMSPWKQINKTWTRETHFIEECALIAYRVLHSLPTNERVFMKTWQTKNKENGIFVAVLFATYFITLVSRSVQFFPVRKSNENCCIVSTISRPNENYIWDDVNISEH